MLFHRMKEEEDRLHKILHKLPKVCTPQTKTRAVIIFLTFTYDIQPYLKADIRQAGSSQTGLSY